MCESSNRADACVYVERGGGVERSVGCVAIEGGRRCGDLKCA